MRTDLENFFDALMHDWATEKSGDTEAPTGYFALIPLVATDYQEAIGYVRDMFQADVPVPPVEDVTGHWIYRQNDQGTITLTRYWEVAQAYIDYHKLETEYTVWLETGEDI